jgi:hypothetical protein
VRVKLFAVAICLFILLTTISITSIKPTLGQLETGEWITKYKVEDSQTNQLLMEVNFETGVNNTYSPILAGSELTVTFTVNVVVSGGGLRLSTNMLHSSIHSTFWSLVTVNYTALGSYNPNAAAVDFNGEGGTFDMIVYGRISNSTVTTKPVPVTLVALSSSGGDILDQIRPMVVNAKVDVYQTLLLQKEDKLQSLKDGGVAAGYIEIYENVLKRAKAEAAAGQVESAVALLHSLDVSNEPVSSTLEAIFLPAIGGLAALAVVFVFLFMRARGKIRYVALVIEDQIKDLEGLTLRASKIDRTISSSLTTIEDRLKRLVGM